MNIIDRQKELLETEAIAVATINEDGSPNVIAVSDAKVVDSSTIVITDNYMKRTPENIKKDSRVCLAVWSKNWSEGGYKFVGTAEYQTAGKWVTYVKAMKENEDFPAKAAIVINVTAIYKLG